MAELDKHIPYMERCLTIAAYGLPRIKSNPMVGSVIVHDNKIISEGYHQYYGGPHAERNAINNLRDQRLLPESTLYISLEPCNHHGKTPPCTDIIIEKRIKDVIIAQVDPNPLMKGKSIAMLKKNNVNITYGVLAHKAAYLNRSFVVNQIEQMPFVMLKWAESKDGYIGKKGQQIWLSNKPAKMLTHKWRSEYDAIMIGTHTAIIDNPVLNNRHYFGSSPIRVVIDRHEKIPKTHNLLSDDFTTWIYTYHKKYDTTSNQKVIVTIPQDLHNELQWIIKDLYRRGVGKLMVEGGKMLHQSIINQNLWHQAQVIKTPTILGSGIRSPKLLGKIVSRKNIIDNKLLTINSLKLNKILNTVNG